MSNPSHDLFALLAACVGDTFVRTDEPMALHTTFKLGGPADFFVCPATAEELIGVVEICKSCEYPYLLIGNGSDLLVSDAGIRGVVISTAERMCAICHEDNVIIADAGADFRDVSAFAAECGLSGCEFACGIPGTVGGAVFMNAGAYDGSVGSVLKYADLVSSAGEHMRLSARELDFGYRQSRVRTEGLIVLSAAFELEECDPQSIRERMDELTALRESKQPLEYASAGSTFKRPRGYYAGKLISDAGLKGYRHGGAQVSAKHAGFVVNTGDATAKDVRELIEIVQDKVKQRFGVTLEPEVRFLGF